MNGLNERGGSQNAENVEDIRAHDIADRDIACLFAAARRDVANSGILVSPSFSPA